MPELVAELREEAMERQARDALCYADGGIETDMKPSDYLGWKAADEIERLRAERAEVLAELKWIVEKHGYQSTVDIIAKVEGAETH